MIMMEKLKMVPSKVRQLLGAKLGQCPLCMRACARGTLACWAVFLMLAFAWPNLIALAVTAGIAFCFTLLMALHLVTYMVRVGLTLRELSDRKIPVKQPLIDVPGRRTFITIIGQAGVAAFLVAVFGRKVAACCGQQGEPLCEGKGIIQVDEDGDEIAGRLPCAGDCPDGKRCHPEASRNNHGGVRQWCGCKDQPEPPECHVVKITPGRGEGGGHAFFTCAGRCPQPQDGCTPVRTVIEQYENGKPKRIAFSCECLEQK
jgi:hypothetical protein